VVSVSYSPPAYDPYNGGQSKTSQQYLHSIRQHSGNLGRIGFAHRSTYVHTNPHIEEIFEVQFHCSFLSSLGRNEKAPPVPASGAFAFGA